MIMSEHHSAVNSALCPFSTKSGPGHITLESLLDSPGLTPPSPLSESVSELGTFDNCGITQPKSSIVPSHPTSDAIGVANSKVCSITETQRQVFLRDVCVELLCILRSQDVNGYFLSSVPALGVTKGHNRVGLLDIERRVFSNNYPCFSDYQNDVLTLLSGSMAYHPDGSLIHTEAQRLFTLASDWFASIHPDQLQLLNMGPPKVQPPVAPLKTASGLPSVQQEEGQIRSVTPPPLAPEVYLGVLNPDNHGVVSRTERIQSIGDEVGQLKSGSYLLPNGGYREDRRNKVIPYTYLDYGPYYSFAPRYDSGASHCSPEANQLILSTSWLPARTAFLSRERRASPSPSSLAVDGPDAQEDDGGGDDEISRAVQSDAVCSALDMGDHQLAVSLAIIEMERQATEKLAAELDTILPGPEVADDCVFGMCLANALTRDILRPDEPGDKMDQQKPEQSATSETFEMSCDLDQSVSTTQKDNAQRELTESASDLRALYRAQYRRLGDTSQNASTTGATLHPTLAETAIAHRLAGRLVDLAKRVKPRDLVHPYAVRRAMGMQPELYALPDTVEEPVSVPSESITRGRNIPVS